jgi:hypothetical protein
MTENNVLQNDGAETATVMDALLAQAKELIHEVRAQ